MGLYANTKNSRYPSMNSEQAPLRRLRLCSIAYVAAVCVITYSLALPLTAIHQAQASVKSASNGPEPRHRRLLGFERWEAFWNSNAVCDLETLQQLKRTIDQLRYQRLNKDVEYQGTAGLDVLVASSLQQLGNSTDLQRTQAWLQTEVTKEVFAVINKQQFPSNCTAVRKLYCRLGKPCGFGCELHHVAHCLSVAVATNRTMIMQVAPSNYIREPGIWNKVFAPLSSCGLGDLRYGAGDSALRPTLNTGSGLQDQAEEVFVGIIDSGALVVDAPAMPSDVLDLVKLFHTRPYIWWQGVLISWLIRPSNKSMQRQESFRQNHSWARPIAGVHVRRTDKLASEAKLHHVGEYMTHVERFCDVRCEPGWQQRAKLARLTTHDTMAVPSPRSECSVYLASDDESVVAEVRKLYSHINIITNPLGTRTGSVQARYTDDGLLGIYDDIVHLARTDFLVGTFSSQVSRLAYEIAQVNTTSGVIDAAFRYHSVDSQWYFGGQQQYRFCLEHDYTDLGIRKLKAGQEVVCPVIHEYDGGYMSCYIEGKSQRVQVPPGSLVPCRYQGGAYRSLLPVYMRKPVLTPSR